MVTFRNILLGWIVTFGVIAVAWHLLKPDTVAEIPDVAIIRAGDNSVLHGLSVAGVVRVAGTNVAILRCRFRYPKGYEVMRTCEIVLGGGSKFSHNTIDMSDAPVNAVSSAWWGDPIELDAP